MLAWGRDVRVILARPQNVLRSELRVRQTNKHCPGVLIVRVILGGSCVLREGEEKCRLASARALLPVRVTDTSSCLSGDSPAAGSVLTQPTLPHRQRVCDHPWPQMTAAWAADAFHFLVTIVEENSFLDSAPN